MPLVRAGIFLAPNSKTKTIAIMIISFVPSPNIVLVINVNLIVNIISFHDKIATNSYA